MSQLLCDVTEILNNKVIIIIAAAVLVLIIILCIIGIMGKSKKQAKDDKQNNSDVVMQTVTDDKNVSKSQDTIAPEQSQQASEEISEQLNDDDGKAGIVNEKKEEKEKEMKTNKVEKNEVNEVETTEVAEVANDKKQYIGKWVIIKKAEGEYLANLKASNGQIVLTSESYSTDKSAKKGIETIKKNIAADNFQIYKDKKDRFFYKLKDSANRLLCIGEVYNTKPRCLSAIESVKRFAEKATISEEVLEDITMIHYVAPENEVKEDETKIKDQYRGRWDITKDEEGLFSATLKASNGQILLNSERYKSLDSVYAAIENYKKNSEKNNYIIDIDKTGKYYYKLRNDQKLTLAVGETYNTQKDCERALESFKRFNHIAKIYDYEEPKPEGK